MSGRPHCSFCGQLFEFATGCDSPQVRHIRPYDGGLYDEPCRDCNVHPGAQHHPGCCLAVCDGSGDEDQALFCDCPGCCPIKDALWAAQESR